MNLHPNEDQLHRFADAELESTEVAAVEAHLSVCLTCAGFVQRLYHLNRVTQRSLKGLRPPEDLWPEILEEASRKGLVRSGWRTLRLPRLAVIGLAAASLAGLLLFRPETVSRPQRDEVSTPIASGNPAATPVRLVLSDSAEASAVLVAEFEARKPFLQPETIATVERNLLIINRAIEDTRLALEGDPGNAHLEEMLQRSQRQKVQYLQTAISLASL